MSETPPDDRPDDPPYGLPVARPLVMDPTYATAEEARAKAANIAFLLPNATAKSALLDVLTLIVLVVSLEIAVTIVLQVILGIDRTALDASQTADGADAAAAEHEPIPAGWLVPMLGLRGLGSILLVAGILYYRRQSARSVGLSRGGVPMECVIGIGACLAAYVSIFTVSAIIANIFPESVDQMQENARRLIGIVPRLSLWGFLGVAVIIGVYEELVFRGFLMTRLRRATRSWTAAVLISTAVFTALHAMDQTPVALVWITILSLIFSLVTIWRRSIVPAIVAHTLFDFTQFVGMALQSGNSWT